MVNKQLTKSEQVLEVIKERGPLFPADIVRQIGSDTILIGALLSDLVSRKKVILTKNLRVGNSPIYYLEGQESQLINFFNYLEESDRRALEILKRNGVLFENDVPEAYLHSLKSSIDFVIPLNISAGTHKYVAYKWFLLSDADAKPIIQKKLEVLMQKINELEQKEIDAVKVNQEEVSLRENITPMSNVVSNSAPTISEDTLTNSAASMVGNNSHELSKKEILSMGQTNGTHEITNVSDFSTNNSAIKISNAENINAEQSNLSLVSLESDLEEDSFLRNSYLTLKHRGCLLESYEIIKKGKEINFFVYIDFGFGDSHYLVKALNKKRLNENDLKIVYADSLIEGLPCILLTNAELNSKAKKLLLGKFRSVRISSF